MRSLSRDCCPVSSTSAAASHHMYLDVVTTTCCINGNVCTNVVFCRTRRDPNLWVVRCRIGEEQATAIALMRKFIAYQFTDDVSMNCVLLSVCTE